MGSIPEARLERRLGRLPEAVLAEIRSAIAFALDLGQNRVCPFQLSSPSVVTIQLLDTPHLLETGGKVG
jgi:hypothetical protein